MVKNVWFRGVFFIVPGVCVCVCVCVCINLQGKSLSWDYNEQFLKHVRLQTFFSQTTVELVSNVGYCSHDWWEAEAPWCSPLLFWFYLLPAMLP
jgi:hypothetical protein